MFHPFGRFASVFIVVAGISFGAEESNHLKRRELKTLLATAARPEDHHRLAEYYRSEAAKFKSKQAAHESEAQEYYRNPARYPVPKYPTMGQHCHNLAWYYGKKAAEATRRADLQDGLANVLQQIGAKDSAEARR